MQLSAEQSSWLEHWVWQRAWLPVQVRSWRSRPARADKKFSDVSCCFSSSLIYELVDCCKRYHGETSKPAVRAMAAKVSVNCTPALEATAPQTALPKARPPCKTSTYIEITRARTQCGAAVCAARFRVARMLIHAKPAAAENVDATVRDGDRTSPQSATAKITVA